MTRDEFRLMIEKTYTIALANAETVRAVGGSGKTFQFEAPDLDFRWFMCTAGDPVYAEGESPAFTVKASMGSEDWVRFLAGELSPIQAAFTRRMKTKGVAAALAKLPLPVLRQAYRQVQASEPAGCSGNGSLPAGA